MADIVAGGAASRPESAAQVEQSWAQSLTTMAEQLWRDAFAQASAVQPDAGNQSPVLQNAQKDCIALGVAARAIGQGQGPAGNSGIGMTVRQSDGISTSGMRGFAATAAEAIRHPAAVLSMPTPCPPKGKPADNAAAAEGPQTESYVLERGTPPPAPQFSARASVGADGTITLYLRAAGWTGAEAVAWAADAVRQRPSLQGLQVTEVVLNGKSVYTQTSYLQRQPTPSRPGGMMVIA